MMKALRLSQQMSAEGLVFESIDTPAPGTGDALVQVRAASYTPGELGWPMTQVDRSGHDRTPAIPCHEVSGVVTEFGFGGAGFAVGDEVYGMTDWYRDGAAAEFVAVEARNLALRPTTIDHTAAATLPLAGLTAWQALFRHGKLRRADTVLVLGAAGGVGDLVSQIARHAGANVISGVRGHSQGAAFECSATEIIDLDDAEALVPDRVSLVVDTVGGETAGRIAGGLSATARFVSIADPAVAQTLGARGMFFVVEAHADTLTALAEMVDSGDLKPPLSSTAPLCDGAKLIASKQAGGMAGKIALRVG